MVAAAAPSIAAQAAIEAFLAQGRDHLRHIVGRFLTWLESPAGAIASAAQAQRYFAVLRVRFLDLITQFDMFSDVLAERSQHGYGEWLGGLDVVAADALRLPGGWYASPPVICHLDRGPGAAIRRVRTRLPGGGLAPVAVIRIPRERMVGSAIASSLVHEVGHQGAELLDLTGTLRDALTAMARDRPDERIGWQCLQTWISEIVADFWSVARVGITSTLGLMSVVSLPRAFVTRFTVDEPHPPPWIRVKISASVGQRLYPDAQWQALAELWESLYPLDRTVTTRDAMAFRSLERLLPGFVDFLASFRPASLGGLMLAQAFPVAECSPARLRVLWRGHRRRPETLAALSPTVACAAIGQAKFDGWLTATAEVTLLRRLLRFWALQGTIDAREICANAGPAAAALVL
ncbi:hypothetical protein PPMP20_17815 [Paraburkholderia phymatum]|nr:hypothetical protein [Paraburkholderia phymatum]